MTPLEHAPQPLLEFAGHGDIRLKREDAHELGVFKWRGALPVVQELARTGHRAVVTASTGNHGAAVAWACAEARITAIVFLPQGATQRKVELLERLAADVRVVGADLDDAKDAAHAFAEAEGLRFFEDGAEPLQYEAYEAIGDEIVEQSDRPPTAVVIPVGNGALAAGVGTAIGIGAPGTSRIGVVAREMPVMAASFEAGRPVDVPTGMTIADGLAVRIPITLAVERLQSALDRVVRVSERAIAEALVACHEAGVAVEPSAAAALAAVRDDPSIDRSRPVVLVMTGGNVDLSLLERARSDPGSFPN